VAKHLLPHGIHNARAQPCVQVVAHKLRNSCQQKAGSEAAQDHSQDGGVSRSYGKIDDELEAERQQNIEGERLIEKLRFALTDTVADPTDEELVNFYADNLSLYYSEPKLSFDQVFYAKPPADPVEVLGRLRSGGQVSGDPFWLGSHFEDYAQSMLRGVLGQRFIEGLHSAPVGEWFGPIESARGTHFVRMRMISPPVLMPYTQVKDQVEDDWFARKRESSVTAKIHKAEEKYDLTIEH